MLNPFEQPGKWYKANLHTHTTMSDGVRTPEETAAGYRRHGYQILAITDHGGCNDMRRLSRQFPQGWKMLRAVVVDAEGRRAWTNPIVLDGKRMELMRQAFVARIRDNWNEPYRSLPKTGAALAWRMLDLRPAANRALYGQDGGIGPGLSLHQMAAGTHRIHGVPFEVLDQNRCAGFSAVALKSEKLRQSAGKPLPESITVRVGEKCRAAYFLHGAGFIGEHEAVAEYVFVYEDGTSCAHQVIALGTPIEDRRKMAGRVKVSAVQDWWPAIQQFENEHARNVIVASKNDPEDHRFIYCLECLNPRPQKVLREIVLRSLPGVASSVVILAVTLRLTK